MEMFHLFFILSPILPRRSSFQIKLVVRRKNWLFVRKMVHKLKNMIYMVIIQQCIETYI